MALAQSDWSKETFELKDVMLEPVKDFMVIYDGADPASPVLLRYAGAAAGPQLLVSSQNRLYIYFYSNYAIAGRGFSVSYQVGCDNRIQDNHGSILSPGHGQVLLLPPSLQSGLLPPSLQSGLLEVPYPNSQRCAYTIQIPDMDTPQPLTLSVASFDVLQDDALRVYDGMDEMGTALHQSGGFGGLLRPPSTFVSKEGHFHLVFKTNPIRASRGWNITFSTSNQAPFLLAQ